MPITKETAGKYKGYTLGRELPTLYFNNGRYTQDYPRDLNNIGWHIHRENITYRSSNINADAVNQLRKIQESESKEDMNIFANQFIKGEFDDADGSFSLKYNMLLTAKL